MPLGKLTLEQAQAIYDEYANDFPTMEALAAKYGVKKKTVSKIWVGETWCGKIRSGKVNRWWHETKGKIWKSRAEQERGWTDQQIRDLYAEGYLTQAEIGTIVGSRGARIPRNKHPIRPAGGATRLLVPPPASQLPPPAPPPSRGGRARHPPIAPPRPRARRLQRGSAATCRQLDP